MLTVIVVIHLMITVVMIGLILIQKSEGNAAGGGFGVSANISSMMQPRTRANPVSRATTILGITFFATSLGLALLAKQTAVPQQSIFTGAPGMEGGPAVDQIRPPGGEAAPAPAPAADSAVPVPTIDPRLLSPSTPAAPAAPPTVPNN